MTSIEHIKIFIPSGQGSLFVYVKVDHINVPANFSRMNNQSDHTVMFWTEEQVYRLSHGIMCPKSWTFSEKVHFLQTFVPFLLSGCDRKHLMLKTFHIL